MPEGAPLWVVNVHQAQSHLSRLIDEAHAGETILLAKAGKPWARLMPLAPPTCSTATFCCGGGLIPIASPPPCANCWATPPRPCW
jgi:prevent-host-death family protein